MTDNLPARTNTLEALAQAHEGEAFALLVEALRDPAVKMEHRIRAAETVMDRARGKAKAALPKDPSQRKPKAISMSVESLMKIVQGAQARTAQQDATRAQARILEGEFVPVVRKRPVNEWSGQERLPAPIVPGTTDDVDELLS